MSYLIDTNICIACLNERSTALRKRFENLGPNQLSVCSVVRAELYYGARNSSRVEENLRRLALFLGPLATMPFDDDAAEQYGVIRVQLRKTGKLIGANDMMIAAIALATNSTLVTRNHDEFRRVAGLRVE